MEVNLNTYEGMFILNPQLSDDETAKVVASIQEEITKNAGRITQVQIMGRLHLAFPIKKHKEGNYLLLNFGGDGSLLKKILPKYRINENILRNLIIKRKPSVAVAPVSK